jgi:hypothetical protein
MEKLVGSDGGPWIEAADDEKSEDVGLVSDREKVGISE